MAKIANGKIKVNANFWGDNYLVFLRRLSKLNVREMHKKDAGVECSDIRNCKINSVDCIIFTKIVEPNEL